MLAPECSAGSVVGVIRQLPQQAARAAEAYPMPIKKQNKEGRRKPPLTLMTFGPADEARDTIGLDLAACWCARLLRSVRRTVNSRVETVAGVFLVPLIFH